MLVHRLRRWPNIETPLGECLVFAGTFIHAYWGRSAHLLNTKIALKSELSNLNFQSLEVVSRYRYSQLQVTENDADS